MSIDLTRAPQVGRWLTPVHSGVATTSQTFTAGRVLLAQVEVPAPCLIDGLVYTVGSVSAGNVTGGLLGPVSRTGDTANGAAVVAQSASTAQSSASVAQVLTWTAVFVAAGIYYAALEGSDATGTYLRLGNSLQATGISGYYDRGGGYGALTDPTPTFNELGSNIPGVRVRVA